MNTAVAPYTAEQIIARYIELRDFCKAEKAAFTERMKPYTEAMEMLEGAAMALMKQTGQRSLSADSGTCFPVQSTTYKVAEPDAWRGWVIANCQWDMFTNHISKEPLEAWLEQHKDPDSGAYDLPPGVSTDSHVTVQFRRG
jgi:hypothetical protein